MLTTALSHSSPHTQLKTWELFFPPLWHKNSWWQVWSGTSEEYHYVSSASSSSSSSSSAAAALRNMPVHITSEQGCVIETVISHLRGAALCALFAPRAGRAEVHLSALLRKRSRLHARWARRPAVTSPSPRAARVRTADSHTTLRQCSSSTALPLPPSIHPSIQPAIHPYKYQPQTFTPQSLELNWAPAARKKNVGVVPFWKQTKKKKRKKHWNVSYQRFYTLHQIMFRQVVFLPEGGVVVVWQL